MQKILKFVFVHSVWLSLAAAVFVSTGARAEPAAIVNVAAVQSPEIEPSTALPTQASAPNPPVAETNSQTRSIAIKHLSRREAQLVRELHRHGIYW
jgi:hypothetical protein